MPPNPLISGFNPDPSIVQVDGAYYLVTSTFEYLPGIPVYRSTDLVSWTQIGNVATRPEQVSVGDVPTGGGVWAPTIRYRDGVFYVIVTIAMSARGCVVFTATDPAGPWSDGTTIDGVGGIDPDLAWDDDGTAYVTFSGLYTNDARRWASTWASSRCGSTSRPARRWSEPRSLWSGTGLKVPEAPHLYHRGDYWYLHDRRGRHRARPWRQRRPWVLAGGSVRGAPGQSGAQRAQHVAPDPEHRPRGPGRHAGRRHGAGAARRAPARRDAGVLAARDGKRSSHRSRGWTAGRSRNRCA